MRKAIDIVRDYHFKKLLNSTEVSVVKNTSDYEYVCLQDRNGLHIHLYPNGTWK